MAATPVTVYNLDHKTKLTKPTLLACDATNGNSAPNGGNLMLELQNSGASPYTVTFSPNPSTVDGQARLVVGNTGYEVEPADVPGLFEPFRRGGWERTGSRGSGLGLSIVRAVCDAHGGTVSAVAQPGGGLEVTVSLPGAATTPVVAAKAVVPRATV